MTALKKMEYKPTNCVVVNPTEKEFFLRWLEFLTPLHKLTAKEIDLAAEFLIKRHEISKTVSNEDQVQDLLFSTEEKDKIRKKFNMTRTYFYTIITKLKRHKFIVNGRLNPKFIPKFSGPKMCQLLIVFDNE